MYARRSPWWIIPGHSGYQSTNFTCNTGSASLFSSSWNGILVEFESLSVPFDHSLWLHDNERVDPFWPALSQKNPEYSIETRNPGSRMMPLECCALLTQCKIFQGQSVVRTEPWYQETKDQPDDFEQLISFHLTMIEWLRGICNMLKSLQDDFWRGTGFGCNQNFRFQNRESIVMGGYT